MNTCFVSASKGIPESNKVGMTSKGNKSEDSFKDMIKSVSSDTKLKEKNNQVKKEEKNAAGSNGEIFNCGESAEEKDDEIKIAHLESVVTNSAGILDSLQLVKIVNLSMGSQAETDPIQGVKSNTTKGDLLATGSSSLPVLEGTKTPTVVTGKLDTLVSQKTIHIQTLQAPLEEHSGQTTDVVVKQETAPHSMVKKQNHGTSQNQNSAFAEQNLSPGLAKENNDIDNQTLTPTGQKLMNSSGIDDNFVIIKVGEPSLDSSWKQVAEEIGNMIVEKVNDVVQKVNITLNPKNLGEIDVEFFINKGKISVSLNCSNEGTKTLLASNLDSLSKIVQSSLMQDVNVNLNHDKTNGQNTNSENFDGRGNNGHYQGDSQQRKKDQEQPNLDFVQKLRLGIEDANGAEV
ncbi:flagellar hook-length control protein FliK [Anaerotignum sp.]|uniref:flagellar hook-length control protein FliK n=1 Tax=Anaerotignum sp. TaxID=2039241 RepID=UPI00332108FE